jgi:2-polyprenyl-3-methyl-5-hydroxy-6-metoxy-1,4-benzoquinol methylase
LKTEVNKPCCVCKSTESELLFEIEYPFYHYPGKFTIRKCNQCGLLFNSPRLPDKEIFNLYNTNYYFFQRHDSDEFRRITELYKRTVAVVQNELIERRVAEIGSGKGYLLAIMKHLGWSVQGIEISSEASKYAISRFGVPTFTGTIESYSSNGNKDVFPVVLAIDVMEHVPNPIEFLNKIDDILCKNGTIIIDTPNGNADNIETLGPKWKGFNPFHIYLFSSQILQLLLVNMGYTIEKCFSYGNCREYSSKNPDKYMMVVKSFLLRLGVFEQSRWIGRKLIHLTQKHENDVEALISNACGIISKNANYFDTDDSKDDLAKDKRGDNIVIIGRKSHSLFSHGIDSKGTHLRNRQHRQAEVLEKMK